MTDVPRVKLLITNGRVVDPTSKTDSVLDILLDRGKILEIAPALSASGARLIDATGLVIAPGFIDMHVHLREPGQKHKETIATGTRAAARGGFTSVCAMPNTAPVNDAREVTAGIRAAAVRTAAVNVHPIAALSRGLRGTALTDMAGLIEAGAVAFSDDGRCLRDSRLMRQAIETAKRLKALIIDHCEDQSLAEGGVMNEGEVSRRLGLPGIPAAAEDIIVARDIILAESLQAGIHIAHLSTKGAAALVREAKRRGVRVSAEVTPHHLLLTEDVFESLGAAAKVNPPLRSAEDVEALLEAVRDGTVDVFATDHAPHAAEEKAAGIGWAPFGMVGLETAVPLLLDRLVGRKVISLLRFVEMLSAGPARLLGLAAKGRIAPGADADLTILDLERKVVVDAAEFQSKSRNSPFLGWELIGAPAMTIVAGRIAYPFGS